MWRRRRRAGQTSSPRVCRRPMRELQAVANPDRGCEDELSCLIHACHLRHQFVGSVLRSIPASAFRLETVEARTAPKRVRQGGPSREPISYFPGRSTFRAVEIFPCTNCRLGPCTLSPVCASGFQFLRHVGGGLALGGLARGDLALGQRRDLQSVIPLRRPIILVNHFAERFFLCHHRNSIRRRQLA